MPILLSGLSLIETLLVLLITSLLITIAAPDFSSLVENKKADNVVRKLNTAVVLAKTTAITQNTIVTLCKSDNGKECGGKWKDGVLVFTDDNADRNPNNEDVVIRYFAFGNIAGDISWNAFQNRQYLQFTQQGFTRYQNGNFTYCPFNRKTELNRQLILNRTARARFAMDSDKDGFREDSSGRPIRCGE